MGQGDEPGLSADRESTIPAPVTASTTATRTPPIGQIELHPAFYVSYLPLTQSFARRSLTNFFSF
jgi:hypothetical protein